MILVLTLFINKLTTPRYLSEIELKINGLILLGEPAALESFPTVQPWTLVANNKKQQRWLEDWMKQLPKKIKTKAAIIEKETVINPQFHREITGPKIAIVNSNQQLIGYFKPPFEKNKMKLTFSSIVAHR